MNRRGNGSGPGADERPHLARLAVVHEDVHTHPVTLPGEDGGPSGQFFNCHSRRWFRAGTDGREGLTVLLIPGIGHNVNFFGPLAKCLLEPARGVSAISQVVSVDLPAHGGSQIPPGIRFGRLSLGNYVEAVAQVVADLRRTERVGRVDVLCGHSMGGIVAMMVAQASVARGATIRDEWGTDGVVLMASALPQGVPWLLVDGPVGNGPVGPVLLKLAPFLTESLRYGLYLAASPEDYLLQFYAVDGKIVATAPALIEAVPLNGCESFAAACELVGFDLKTGDPLTRPLIDEGLFKGYALGVVSYSEDALFRPREEHALGTHVYGDEEGWTYLAVEGAEAVHCMPYPVPDASFPLFEDVTRAVLRSRAAEGAETT